MTSDWLKEKATAVIQYLQQLLEKEKANRAILIRDDYKQCAENTLALLQVPPVDFFHHRPGATASARWMGKVLYCQKMFMWSNQMQYESDFVDKLRRINQFIALFYVPAWLKCSIGVDAPINDLEFLQNMIEYRSDDHVVADSAFKKLSSHKWYLNEETVAFSFLVTIAACRVT